MASDIVVKVVVLALILGLLFNHGKALSGNGDRAEEFRVEDEDIVPYHTLFVALLKKLEDFRKSDPFLESDNGKTEPVDGGAESRTVPAPDERSQKLKLATVGSNGGKQITKFAAPVAFRGTENGNRSPNFEEFEQILSDLKSHPAEPREIRRQFLVEDEEISQIADVSRRFHFSAEFNVSGSDARLSSCHPRPNPNCDPPKKYRSFEGTCNNLKNPFWGSFLHPYQRFLPPEYEDGRSLPRGATYSPRIGYTTRLPQPRQISISFHSMKNTSDEQHSHMFMQFGQFLIHDIAGNAKEDYDCCNPKLRSRYFCFPVSLRGDRIFEKINRNCMTMTRSSWNCHANKPWVEQFNGVTSFLDLSNIYGATTRKNLLLRGGNDRRDGLMVEGTRLNRFVLPTRSDLGLESVTHDSDQDHFISGDTRNMVQPTLLSIQNIFLLEHNRIARGIGKALEGKLEHATQREKDELIFQESRRIFIAEMQAVVYREFLPAFLPMHVLEKHKLSQIIPDSTYDENVDPSIRNEFATAAFRFGHSIVQDIFQGRNQPWRLSNGFGDPTFAVRQEGRGFENEMKGACQQQQQRMDRHLGSELNNKLFANKKLLGKEKANSAASDLSSTNIQRGRDHGIGNYNSARKLAGLLLISSMRERPEEIEPENWDLLSKLYLKPDDIDLFTGGLAEFSMEGGLLGPTFSWIISEQFRLLKEGDRFFFTHQKAEESLPKIIQEMIMKRTLGDILCENTRTIAKLQRRVMLVPGPSNEMIACRDRRRQRLNFSQIANNIVQATKRKTSVSSIPVEPLAGVNLHNDHDSNDQIESTQSKNQSSEENNNENNKLAKGDFDSSVSLSEDGTEIKTESFQDPVLNPSSFNLPQKSSTLEDFALDNSMKNGSNGQGSRTSDFQYKSENEWNHQQDNNGLIEAEQTGSGLSQDSEIPDIVPSPDTIGSEESEPMEIGDDGIESGSKEVIKEVVLTNMVTDLENPTSDLLTTPSTSESISNVESPTEDQIFETPEDKPIESVVDEEFAFQLQFADAIEGREDQEHSELSNTNLALENGSDGTADFVTPEEIVRGAATNEPVQDSDISLLSESLETQDLLLPANERVRMDFSEREIEGSTMALADDGLIFNDNFPENDQVKGNEPKHFLDPIIESQPTSALGSDAEVDQIIWNNIELPPGEKARHLQYLDESFGSPTSTPNQANFLQARPTEYTKLDREEY